MEELKTLATRLLMQSGNDVNKALPGFVRVEFFKAPFDKIRAEIGSILNLRETLH